MYSLLLIIIYLAFISLGLPDSLIGFEMASAYVGTIAMPPLFGLIAQHVTIALLPLYIGALTVVMFVCLEVLNAQMRKKQKAAAL